MSNRPRPTFVTTRTCETGRHLLCPSAVLRCDCSCHKPMSVTHAQSVILRLARERLWPDDPTEQQQLVDKARGADPFAADLHRAATVLGLLA